jgi:5-methylcytosine-specific restriction enzyme A
MEQNNSKKEVVCAECGAPLLRRPINPNTGVPIKAFFCDHTCKGNHQKRVRPITKEQAEQMYLRDGMSAVDIGKAVGRHPKGVWNWLQDWGIPTRPRGADERQHFAKGHKTNVGMKMPDSQRAAISAARKADGSKGLFRANGDHVLKGVRGDKHPSWKGGCTPIRNAFYGSDEWKIACVEVWHKADAKCERCGLDHRKIDRKKLAFHIHHIASFSIYPDLRADPENLKLLCAPCHRWVHSRLNTENLFIKREPKREKTRV